MTPAERLRDLMAASPHPDRENAERAGMSPARWSHIKTGVRADPSLSTTGKILRGLGLDWSALNPAER